MKRPTTLFALALLLTHCFISRAQDSSTQPAIVDVSDKDGITAAMGKEVTVEGTVSTAEWSRSGAVLNIDFQNADATRFLAVAFKKSRETLDQQFSGDLAKTLAGAKIRVHGKVQEYGGKQESFKGRPQIIIQNGAQITIVEPAASQPAQ